MRRLALKSASTLYNASLTCSLWSIEAKILDGQILEFLRSIELPQTIHDWALNEIAGQTKERKDARHDEVRSLDLALQRAMRKLSNLTDLRLDEAIGDNEFASKRKSLENEKIRLGQRLKTLQGDERFEPERDVLSFMQQARYWFEHGDYEVKRMVLKTACSNPCLKDQIINVQAKKPFLKTSNMSKITLVRRVRDSNPRIPKDHRLAICCFRPLSQPSIYSIYLPNSTTISHFLLSLYLLQ